MRLSFSTLGCPSWSLAAVVDAAGRLGYDGVELRFLQNDDALWARPELTGDGLRETRARLRDAGLAVSCVDTRSFFHHPDRAARDTAIAEAERSIELAASLGASGIRVFGDRIQPGQDRASTRGFIADALFRLSAAARAHGVEVWLESHGDFARAADTLSVFEGMATDGLGILWDPANAFETGEAPAAGLAALGDRARHVHLKDVARDRARDGGGWIPRLPGQGEFAPERVLALLRARGYDRWVSFEWEKKWHPSLEEPEVALPTSRAGHLESSAGPERMVLVLPCSRFQLFSFLLRVSRSSLPRIRCCLCGNDRGETTSAAGECVRRHRGAGPPRRPGSGRGRSPRPRPSAAAPGSRAAPASAVRVWEGTLELPTYEEGLPTSNPPFDLFETRRYNYPYTLRENLSDRRAPTRWRTLNLENEYLKVVVLPDLGGHLYSCVDKVNGADLFYANTSIKKAKVSYRGAWTALGIEFNFPVSHNWVTASPVDYALQSNPDGSASIWVGNQDRVYGMQWRVALTLRPGLARLEQDVALYNRSDTRHRFYWWNNAGVRVWDDSRIEYPMRFTASHGFRAVDTWPVNQAGVDQTVVGNHTSGPVSEFSHGSREPFMGVYHPRTRAGVVHYSSPMDAPTKKIWSWGSDPDGLDWRKALSDDESAYVEVQAGLFRNQETYAFLSPQESIRFTESWMPVREIGGITRANPDAVLHLSRAPGGGRPWPRRRSHRHAPRRPHDRAEGRRREVRSAPLTLTPAQVDSGRSPACPRPRTDRVECATARPRACHADRGRVRHAPRVRDPSSAGAGGVESAADRGAPRRRRLPG